VIYNNHNPSYIVSLFFPFFIRFLGRSFNKKLRQGLMSLPFYH